MADEVRKLAERVYVAIRALLRLSFSVGGLCRCEFDGGPIGLASSCARSFVLYGWYHYYWRHVIEACSTRMRGVRVSAHVHVVACRHERRTHTLQHTQRVGGVGGRVGSVPREGLEACVACGCMQGLIERSDRLRSAWVR